MAATPPATQVVIFDLDGLLLDSESAIIEVAEQVCQRYGKELTMEAVSKALGRSPSMAWQITADVLGIERTGDELFTESEALLCEKWATTKLMPGALRLLNHLKEHKVPFGLATSTSSQRIYTKMKGKEFIVEAMQFTVFGDEVKHGKPDPEIYLEAARRAGGVDPGRCLVIEDSPCGVKSACGAGMRVIAVPSISDLSKYPQPKPDAESGCAEHLASLLEFRPEKYGLPPFTDYIGDVTPLDPAWTLKGSVVKGFGRGSKVLGIPTANVDMKSVKEQLGGAVCGIYCGYAALSTTGAAVYPFAMSIGRNPQFNNQEKSAEPWLLHTFAEDFYGAEIRLIILGYIRAESAFTSLEALIERIHRDGEVAKEFLEKSEAARKARTNPFLTGEGRQVEAIAMGSA